MAYQKQTRGTRILEVKCYKTGEVVFPFLPQDKCCEVLEGFTPNDVKNIPHILSGIRHQIRGYSFRLLGVMVKA
jgi:hypothetical protein